MTRIDSKAKTIRELLTNTKYKLDYYQREYSWQTQHVSELIDDLTNKFLDFYKEGHERIQVQNYGHYFLGSIIISNHNGQRYIVDGQQRLTTLTLILIKLHRLLEDEIEKSQIAPLIYSLSLGTEGFNLDVPEWKPIMSALYSGNSFDTSHLSESIRNIDSRYNEIEDCFEIEAHALSHFVDWLLENVYLVEITAYDSKDAYAIFETVNDRGLSLTPADMLRGYLLSNITESVHRNHVSDVWQGRVEILKQIGKEKESEAIKAWLRSQYAARNRDFELIGSEFHRWVRESEQILGLTSIDSFTNFIERDFDFYSDWYHRLRVASKSLKIGLECVHYNAQHNFTLQYPVLLASLCIEDTEEVNIQKVQIVATFLDILIHRYIWNSISIAQRSMVTPMFSLICEIRGKGLQELTELLFNKLEEFPMTFARNSQFGLHTSSKSKIHLVLARMTNYVEVQSASPSRYQEYVKKTGNSYEIEHIWANHFERHLDEFSHQFEFEAYRDRIGGLLLLPKKNNASYSDLLYQKKREHYLKENLLAQSLHEKAYENNPGFKQFIERSNLLFCPYTEFKKVELDSRQKLYQLLAERIWNPERLRLPYGQEPNTIIVEAKNEYVSSSHSNEQVMWTAERIRDLVPQDRRIYYETNYKNKSLEFYRKTAELQNIIHGTEWDHTLNLEFQRNYCGFYLENHPVFGVNLYGQPRFSVWITKEDAEQFSNQCEFDAYYPHTKYAIYPQEATVEQLHPIFEFAFKKLRGY